jgi:uncharacterized protein YbaP (TraB family)
MSLRIAVVLLLALFAAPLAAVPLWSVENSDGAGTVLLLGSVHLLRAEDQPLPAAVRTAYERAERLVMELDPTELEPGASQAALQRVGIMSPGASAAETLTAEEWRRAEILATEAGVDLQAVAMLEPWFAALALYAGALADSGYDPALGVDQQVADWARRDAKPVLGLETLDEQLLLFKRLEVGTQREMLLKTLEELVAMEDDTARLIEQWRNGDLAALARRLETDFRGYEELRASLVTERNRAWLPAIEALLHGGGTTLVVVGALHLVGPEGLPALLEALGWRVTPSAARAPDYFVSDPVLIKRL